MNKDFKIGDYVRVSEELAWTDFIETGTFSNRTIQQFRVNLENNKTYRVSDIMDDHYLVLDGVGHNCTTTVSTTRPIFNKIYFVKDIKTLRKEKLLKINSIFGA